MSIFKDVIIICIPGVSFDDIRRSPCKPSNMLLLQTKNANLKDSLDVIHKIKMQRVTIPATEWEGFKKNFHTMFTIFPKDWYSEVVSFTLSPDQSTIIPDAKSKAPRVRKAWTFEDSVRAKESIKADIRYYKATQA